MTPAPAEPRTAPPTEPERQPEAEPSAAPDATSKPVLPEPIGPVRSFEPVPIPEGMAPPGVRTTPYAPDSAPPPPRPGPPPVDNRPGARLTPTVPGAAEAGLVVVDPQRVFGADALPRLGASIIRATGFTLAASVNARYDDNFLRIEGDLPPGARDSKSDILVTPLALIGFGRQVNRQAFSLAASVGRNLLLRNEDRETDRVQVDGGWDWRAGAFCSGRLGGGWSTNEVRATDQLVRTNPVNRVTILSASGSCNLPSRLVPGLNVAVGKNRFRGERLPVVRLNDSEFWSIAPSLGYALSARAQVGVQASVQDVRFPNQPLDPGLPPPGEAPPSGNVNGVESVGVSGFITYRLSRRVAANGVFGYTKTKSKAPLADDFSGWTGNLGVNYADVRWGAALSAGRSVSLGRDALANFVIESVVNGTVTYRLRPRVTLSSGVDLAELDRRGGRAIPVGGLRNFEDSTRRAFFGTDLTLSERLVLGFDYFHEVRKVEALDFKTNSDQVAGTLRFVFR
ncbi:hypothetical protein [Thermaurantiacus sp.]